VSASEPHNHSKLSQPHTSPQPNSSTCQSSRVRLPLPMALGRPSPVVATHHTHCCSARSNASVRACQRSAPKTLAASVAFRGLCVETVFGAPLTHSPPTCPPTNPTPSHSPRRASPVPPNVRAQEPSPPPPPRPRRRRSVRCPPLSPVPPLARCSRNASSKDDRMPTMRAPPCTHLRRACISPPTRTPPTSARPVLCELEPRSHAPFTSTRGCSWVAMFLHSHLPRCLS
jgi:hypothetical protein